MHDLKKTTDTNLITSSNTVPWSSSSPYALDSAHWRPLDPTIEENVIAALIPGGFFCQVSERAVISHVPQCLKSPRPLALF
jgi:hypothetical protein